MLTAPSIANVNGVTVWGDDTDFFKFYLTSAHPRVRLNDQGEPIFLLVQYAISDDDRIEDSTLPDGAGYMNFDVTFSISPDEELAAREEMQMRVDAEWNRLRNGSTAEKNMSGVKGTTEPPQVEFGSPTYTNGTVNMYAPQSELLVDKQVAQGVPDLMSGNVGVFSMDLTEAGSEFMHQTLTEGAGSDLTPIQIGYVLYFWARLPPVDIWVTADSERIYQQTRKFMDGSGTDWCTTYDFQQTDMNTSLADISGLIDVKIDPGSASVDDEVMQELRQYALDMMQQMIESNFFTNDPADGYYPGVDDEIPKEFLEKESKNQRRNGNSKKYLKKSFDKTSMNLELHLQQAAVVEWNINPQSTLETFFAGRPPSEIAKFVRRIRLDNPLFKNLDFTARVFGEFETTDLEAVEVQLKYSGIDFNGERVSHETSMTFTENNPQSWSPSLIGSEREVEYRFRSKIVGGEFGPFSDFSRTSTNSINISIPTPGVVSRSIVASALNFDALELRSVIVVLRYEDAELDVPPHESTVLLTKASQTADFVHKIGVDARKPVLYSRRFSFESGEIIEDDEFTESLSQTLFINQPFNSVMEVRLLPVGRGWNEVVQVTIELFYKDEDNAFDVSEVVTLKTHEDLRVWTVRLRNPDLTEFSYRINASYKNGDHEESDLITDAGSGVVPITVREPKTTEVTIVPNRLDFSAASLSEVVLIHPESGTTTALTFTDHTRQTWTVPVRPGDPLVFTSTVTHFPMDSDPVIIGPITEMDTALILPPYRAPEAGKLTITFMPTLINFDKTPLVTVDLLYEDEANSVTAANTLGFSKDSGNQIWAIDVKDLNRRLFSMKITYFVAPENAPVEQELKFLSQNLVVLAPFSAPET